MCVVRENTLLHIFLKDWVPALLTTLIGGLLIALLIPRFQASFEKSRALESRRLNIMEATAKHFMTYIVSWERLIQIAEFESSRKARLPTEVKARKEGFVKERNEARIHLLTELETASLYFNSPNVKSAIQDFKAWDKDQTVRELSHLPSISEWEKWKEKVVEAMEHEVQP